VVLLTVGGLMDTLDGVVAKAAGTASRRALSRLGRRAAGVRRLIFGGVAWYFASGIHPRLAVLPVRDLRRQRRHLL